MALLPKVKLKAMLSFPSAILDGAGIDVTRVNGSFKFDLAFDDFAPPVAGIADPANTNALLWNSATDTYVLAPVNVLGSAGTVPEAPNDGVQYGRQSNVWTPVVSGGAPSNTTPLMDGIAAAGSATPYSRGDHIHPTDTSRAPLASPIFTGDPRAPTPTAGDNDTSLATTAFVTTAVASASGSAPSNVSPVMDGTAAPGVSALYSRGDHVHPSDTAKQNAGADLTALEALGGTGIARRTATTPTWSTGDPVTNSELSVMPIYTLKGNSTSSLAAPTDIDIAALPAKISPAGGDFLLLSDQSASGALRKVGIANLPGASGGISDAPNDGQQYGRQSLGWTVVSGGGTSPSNVLPAMDGPASAGTATLYSRGDHVHPTDISRAPLASPTLTGDPKAPTPTAGDNDTSIATTAFVTTAVAGIAVVSPSNANPIVDGTAVPGVATLYSRGDHVHPTDTSRAALASPTFTGDPRAPTPTAGDNDTSIATTAFVTTAVATGSAAPSNANPIIDGTVAPGVSALYSRGDHVHPTDISRAAANTVVRYDTAQSLTDPQQVQARQNIYAAPFDAMAYSGMQVNGGMEVSQERGATGTSANASYVCDGWRMFFAGTMAVTGAQASAATFWPGFTNVLTIQFNTAQTSLGAGDFFQVVQFVEGYRISRLAWGMPSAKPVTIGFWSAHTPAGIYTVAVQNSPVTRSYVATYTQDTAAVPQYNVITIPGDTAGTWKNDNTTGITISFAAAGGTTYTAPSANTWTAGNYIAALGQVNAAASTSNVFRMTGVVVLPGTQAPTAAQSPLLMRPYDQELILCKRYYQRFGDVVASFILQGWTGGAPGNNISTTVTLSPAMRATPTLTQVGTWVLTQSTVAFYPDVNSIGWQLTATVANVTAAHYPSAGYLAVDARL